MTDEKLVLTDEQAQAVRQLDEAQTALYNAPLKEFDADVLQPAIDALAVGFPAGFKAANAFYTEEELFLDLETMTDNHLDMVASYVFLSYLSLQHANTISTASHAMDSLSNDLSDLRSFTPLYDWERGFWKD